MDDRQRAILDEIHAGAREAGVDIEDVARVEVKSDEFSKGDRLSLSVDVDESGRPVSSVGVGTLRLEVFEDGLEWRADTSDGETHTSTTGRSPRQAARDAMAAVANESGELVVSPRPQSDIGSWEPDISIYRRAEDVAPIGDEPGSEPESSTPDGDIEPSEGPLTFDGWEPDISIYQRREQEPYTGRDVEPIEHDPIRRSAPHPDDQDDEPEPRSVRRVAREPAFSPRGRRRLPPQDPSPISRLVKIGIPLLIAILLLLLGINLFADDTPAPLVGPPATDGDDVDDTLAGNETTVTTQVGTTSATEVPPEDTTVSEDPPTVNLGDLATVGLTNGQGFGVPSGQSFDAFFHAVFIPQEALEVNEDLEARVAAVNNILSSASGGPPIFGIELTQFQGEPSANPPSQMTVGYVVEIDGTTYDFAVVGAGPGYTEVSVGRINFCVAFPECDNSTITFLNIGGPPDLDIDPALVDALAALDADDIAAAVDANPPGVSDYGWVLQFQGGLQSVAGTGE